MVKALLFLTLLSTCAVVIVQDQQPATRCPTVAVYGPDEIVLPNELMTYRAEVKDQKRRDLKYVWSVNRATIVSGQGTPVLKIRQLEGGSCPTVTVEVIGFPNDCPSRASESISCDPLPQAERLDQISWPLNSQSQFRLKSIATAVENSPHAQLYVFIPSDATIRTTIAQELSKTIPEHDIDISRMTFIENGSKNSLIQFWLVPPGATPPSKCEGCEPPVSAPATTPANCPILEVSGPSGVTPPGNIMPFVLLVSDPGLKKLSFAWTVSAGAIVEGQGMRVVKVKAPTPSKPISLTASVHISGLPRGCTDTASISSPVASVSK